MKLKTNVKAGSSGSDPFSCDAMCAGPMNQQYESGKSRGWFACKSFYADN